MKRRTTSLVALLILCLMLLCGCTSSSNPLVQAEATAVPGNPLELHTTSASTSSEFVATLYYRFLDSDMLAAESRTLTVQRDMSSELAVLQALFEGPSADNPELRRLFEDNVTVEDTTSSGDTLFVTLNEKVLDDGIPADWQRNEAWASEAPLRRMLSIKSIVNTITENFAYSHVQIMIARENTSDTRLDRSYFLTGQTGPSDSFIRDESCLLTAYRTASVILQAWQERDYQTLYTFTASYADFEVKPIYESFLDALSDSPALSSFSLSPGNVSENGQQAVLSLSLVLNRAGSSENISSYPLRLVRENGVWKITWYYLRRLMLV